MSGPLIPYHAFTLDNGLRVLVHERATTPIVSVNVWYHVGSRNERAGLTGFAHLFEHLMFEGSRNVPTGQFDQLLEEAGGINNGSTSTDRTNYWETVPSGALDLALFLEADRMGGLLDAVTQRELDAQRDVVMNERRQSYENRPYGLASELILAALYPAGHPYSWPVIGSMADIAAARLEDVHSFFRTWYVPNNATLAVAGDVRTADVESAVHRAFGGIPMGAPVPVLDAQHAIDTAVLRAPVTLLHEDDITLPRIYITWHSPALYTRGDAELDVAARVIADGKASRLYRELVYEQQSAQSVTAYQSSAGLASTFRIVITARPGHDLNGLAAHALKTVKDIAADGISAAELERARNTIETGFVDGLQSVGGFGGRADQLNHYLFYTGDAGYAERDIARYAAVTAASVAETVRDVLLAPAVTLTVVPRGAADIAVGGAT